MTTDGSMRIINRLRTLCPIFTEDGERQQYMSREMDKANFDEQQMNKAIDEFLTLGEKELNPTQVLTIAYRIVRQEYRTFFRGPFFWSSSKGQTVYYVVVEDSAGARQSGYVRCGGWWLGLLSVRVEVRWDA